MNHASSSNQAEPLVIALAMLGQCLCMLLVAVPYFAGMWKAFVKAGKPGWAALVPVYNYMVLAEVAGRESWFGLLLLVPGVNIVILCLLLIEVAKAFGKEPLFGVGLILFGPICWPVLGFGAAQYQGRQIKPPTAI